MLEYRWLTWITLFYLRLRLDSSVASGLGRKYPSDGLRLLILGFSWSSFHFLSFASVPRRRNKTIIPTLRPFTSLSFRFLFIQWNYFENIPEEDLQLERMLTTSTHRPARTLYLPSRGLHFSSGYSRDLSRMRDWLSDWFFHRCQIARY